VLVPCDTNGGTLPHEIAEVVAAVVARFPGIIIGIHPHSDTDCGTANALAAVRAARRTCRERSTVSANGPVTRT
jgi:2-isopropylmalate synthase